MLKADTSIVSSRPFLVCSLSEESTIGMTRELELLVIGYVQVHGKNITSWEKIVLMEIM